MSQINARARLCAVSGCSARAGEHRNPTAPDSGSPPAHVDLMAEAKARLAAACLAYLDGDGGAWAQALVAQGAVAALLVAEREDLRTC